MVLWACSLFVLCCVAVTAPAFADFSYFEALERFFVEVVAFRVVAQSIVWISLLGRLGGVVGIGVIHVERHVVIVGWSSPGLKTLEDDK